MIRWITDDIGTGPYDNLEEGDWTVIDVRHLVDKAGNADQAVVQLIKAGVEALEAKRRVVVACDFGVSRSNAIAAGILAASSRKGLSESLRCVTEATGETQIKLDLVRAVRRALNERSAGTAGNATLITGASGFIGKRLLDRLGSAGAAYGISRTTLNLEGSATDIAAFCADREIGNIVHLAFPRVYTNVESAGSSIVMLRNLLDVCKNEGARLFVVSGSIVFNGRAGDISPSEADQPYPKGMYAETKYLEEIITGLHSERGDVDAATLRLAPVYGPGGDRPRLIRTFSGRIDRGEVVSTHRFRNGRPALDLLYVDDAVEGIARAVEQSASGIYHFGTGQLHTTVEIAQRMAFLKGKDLRHDELFIDDDTGNVAFPSQRARVELGWEPKTSLDDGLRACLEAF